MTARKAELRVLDMHMHAYRALAPPRGGGGGGGGGGTGAQACKH